MVKQQLNGKVRFMTYQIIDGYKISPSCGKVLRTGHGRTVGRCLRNARRQHPALYGGGYFIVVDGKDMTAEVNAQLARREELAARCCHECGQIYCQGH